MPQPRDDAAAIPGERLRATRLRRGLTQEALAELAGLSLGVVKKLERGGTGRLETYHALARALRVRTSDLLEPTVPHQTRRGDADKLNLLSFRQVITPPIGPAGRMPAVTADPEPDLLRLADMAGTVALAYHTDDYGQVAELLPPLVSSAHVAVSHFAGEPDHLRALRVRSDVLQMAGRYLTQVRAYDLAHVALRDATDDALAAGAMDAVAGAVYQQGWLLMRQGRLEEAEAVSISTAEAVEPRISKASRRDLGAWGKLLVHASAAAARNNKPQEAREMLRLGRTAGTALAGATAVAPSSWGRFDWRTITFQHIENQLVADRPERVLGLAERVRGVGDVTFMRRHLLDVAAANAALRRRDEATSILEQLRAQTPAWLRHQQMATQIFHQVQRLNGRVTARHRELAKFFDAP
ncbi:helix-turn-helix domain-containing protein [Actinacidiphila sp. DG2A-62]|uniref:helix-turn-helix domain-containing protein n=1 Tax=Actinacidiphila sp. DG2A-62 TaxID=3108821 RepID=UPI003FA3C8E5